MKKASVHYLVVFLVLAVILLVFGSFFIAQGAESIEKSATREQCKSSVRTAATLKALSGDDFGQGITCSTTTPTITKGEIEDVEQAQERIADELYYCSNNFGQGKNDLFGEEGIYCHVCALISFDTDETKTISLQDYLETTPAPAPNHRVTYAQYLAGFESKRASEFVDVELPEDGFRPVQTNKDYAVLFWHGKGAGFVRSIHEKLGTEGSTAVGFLVGGATGAAAGLVSGKLTEDDLGYISAFRLVEWNEDQYRQLGCTENAVAQR